MSTVQKRRGDLLHEDLVLVGDIPTTGEVWRSGSVAPSNGLGINKDYYYNDVNGNVYQRQAGAYVIIGNFSGTIKALIFDADTIEYFDGGDPSTTDTDILDFGTP